MKVQHVINCSFSSWYETFQKVTWKSIIIPLTQDFVTYLLADGLVLPEGSCDEVHYDRNSDDDLEEEVDWNSEETPTARAPQFPLLDAAIKDGIKKLGGTVFPKLNWSSAKDATWVTFNNSMRCSIPGDIYLLLKSSDFITHDLSQPFKDCEGSESENASANIQYELVLRKWVDINPSMEFRCFVKNGHLIGISQRDCTQYYSHIKVQKEDITQDIFSFFHEQIWEKFPDKNYVFDVYRPHKDKVKLMDFNPFGETTDSQLFDWDDLKTDIESVERIQKPDFRYITSDSGVQPSPYRHYRMPKDVVDMKLMDFLKLKDQASVGDSDSD